ncbi:MAG: acetyl-CoA carboxylase biotin carboxyl carrier protein [Armatimonadota bacterium]|jgi:acetyl-CoA carboxylase biotin carboxyl carrier protein
MAIDRDTVQRIIDLLSASNAAEIEIEDGDRAIRVARGPVAPAALPVSVSEEPAGEVAEEAGAGPVEVAEVSEESSGPVEYVTAGLVGLFHHGRAPDDRPIVAVGDSVSAGQVIGTIEALRKLTDVVAPCGGVIRDVLVEDGESVQFGDRLFAIRPEE